MGTLRLSSVQIKRTACITRRTLPAVDDQTLETASETLVWRLAKWCHRARDKRAQESFAKRAVPIAVWTRGSSNEANGSKNRARLPGTAPPTTSNSSAY